ncbi:hypothetical protein PCANC_16015 [Puccinia coronata f. sp. avenae]|uniref:Integrase catalytic domain-containing protein n=1 Tax=Puccinia coronata f. sp. avenae TaxID=200324 RepID=A0A2N5ULN1_9BASI|nr:hypothetical protein PCANC_16015 [Puccinia coronata f. sp. avenae]
MANEISLKDQLSTLPTLNGNDNYPMWSCRISAFLKHRDLYTTVTVEPAEVPTTRAVKQLSESANILLTKISDKLYNRIITDENDNNGYLIWTRIKDLYAKRTGLRLSRCLTQWHRIRYDGNLTKYLYQVEACLATFDSISYKQEGSAICGVITSALSKSRSSLTDPILTNESLMNDPVLLLTKLRDIAYNKRTRKKPLQSKKVTAVIATNSCRTRPPSGCTNNKHKPDATHPEHNCWALYPDKKKEFDLRRSAAPAHHHTAAKTKAPSQHETPAFASVTTASCHISLTTPIPSVLDSGASHHMFNDISFFVSSEDCRIPISTGRNSTDLTATKTGVAAIVQSDGTILKLPNSLYVPGLSLNLISMLRLSTKTTLVTRGDDSIQVLIDDDIRFNCSYCNDVLEIIGTIGPVPSPSIAFISSLHSHPTTPFQTWHHRLGHAGLARLKAVLPNIHLISSASCDACMKGKISRLPFQGHFDRTSQPLETVHADLVGPISPSTNSGARYFLTLVDQHTGYISITLLKKKSDATSAILDFQLFFEQQTGFPMRRLVLDGGGEFCNRTLLDYLKDSGIQHNVAPPYTPQHNGVAERANKTIINMARCMMVQSNLAKEWWGEAVRTVAATTNCLPSLSRSKISPLEQLFKKQPNFRFFRPFGCKAWIVKPNHARASKFDTIAWDGILLGYSNDYSCYRIVKLDTMTLVDVKHAWFDESTFPSLRALRPSSDISPHSSLPDFSGAASLPFDDDSDNDDSSPAHSDARTPPPSSPILDNDVDMDSPPDHDDSSSEDDSSPIPDSPLPSPKPRRLVLRLGPHPTKISSTINPSNILARRTRSAAAFSFSSVEPGNRAQAMSSDDRDQWAEAELKELENMFSHSVWDEIPRQTNHHTIPSTWAYRKKLGSDNKVVEFKARICAQGFRQTHGLNFDLKYAPTGKPTSLRLLISHAVNHGLLIHQLDVKSAFLTCDLDEEVFMLPPPGYRSGDNIVLKLRKAIYGLKQASLAWYRRLSSFLVSIGFTISVADPCVFWRLSPSPLWIFSHVDDLIIFGSDPLVFCSQIEKEFQIKYLGEATFLLGMKLDRCDNGVLLNQSQYVERKLVEFSVVALPVSSCPLDPRSHLQKASDLDQTQFLALNINYQALIGSLNYLSILTRPDISFSTENPQLRVFVNANWANCPDTRRSHSGFLVLLNQHLLSWKSTKQPTVSLSTTEAEYKALADACKDTVWIQNLSSEIFDSSPSFKTTVFVDNRGAIDLALSQVSQNGFRTKHMDLRLHFIRDLITQKLIDLKFVGTQDNLSDFLTKPVGCSQINRSLKQITGGFPSFSASSLAAQSMPACQITADSVMQDICDEIALDEYGHVGQDQASTNRP